MVLLEGREVGWAASGRNGGFCAASLTHGLPNGLTRWPGEIHRLQELGARNLDEIERAVARHGIDCDFERTGEIDVATETYQAWELRDWYEEMEREGLAGGVEFLDADAVRAQVISPRPAPVRPAGVATLDPVGPPAGGVLDQGVRLAPARPPPRAPCTTHGWYGPGAYHADGTSSLTRPRGTVPPSRPPPRPGLAARHRHVHLRRPVLDGRPRRHRLRRLP
ncbi:hypothetical protein SGLAM104S_04981 [Streptomyces glaucescens]